MMCDKQLSFKIQDYYYKVCQEMRTLNISKVEMADYYYAQMEQYWSQTEEEKKALSVRNFFSDLRKHIEAGRMYMATMFLEYKNNRELQESLLNLDDMSRDSAAKSLASYYSGNTYDAFSKAETMKNGDISSLVDIDILKELYLLNEQIFNNFRTDPIIRDFLGMDDPVFLQAASDRLFFYQQYHMSSIGLSDEVGVFNPTSEEETQAVINKIIINIQRAYARYLSGKEQGKTGEEAIIQFKKRLFSQIKNKHVLLGVLPTINMYELLFENGVTLIAIDNMSEKEFTLFTVSMLQRIGYSNVVTTNTSEKQGVDVIAEKEGVRYAIRCKCDLSDLDNTSIQEVNAGKYYYHCHVGVVLTNRFFNENAKELAQVTGTLLWNRDKLASMLAELNQ